MKSREEQKADLKRKAKKTTAKVERLLADELSALKEVTRTDLEKLRPKITDEETYQRLIDAVEESTRRNESIAQLKSRVEKLGAKAVEIAKKIAGLL